MDDDIICSMTESREEYNFQTEAITELENILQHTETDSFPALQDLADYLGGLSSNEEYKGYFEEGIYPGILGVSEYCECTSNLLETVNVLSMEDEISAVDSILFTLVTEEIKACNFALEDSVDWCDLSKLQLETLKECVEIRGIYYNSLLVVNEKELKAVKDSSFVNSAELEEDLKWRRKQILERRDIFAEALVLIEEDLNLKRLLGQLDFESF